MSNGKQLQIVSVDHLNGNRVVVEFSDDTEATFTLDQLLSLLPDRAWSNELKIAG
jgi:hypothetical protein